MAAGNAIRISILANARDAIRGINKTIRAVDKLDRSARSASRPNAGISGLNKELAGLTKGLGKATGALKAGGKVLGVSLMGFIATGILAGTAQVASALSAGLLATLPAVGVLPGFALAAASAFTVLKVATSGLADAMTLGLKAASTGATKNIIAYNKALDKLSPSARAVTQQMVALHPALLKVRNAISGKFFAGFSVEIKALAGTYLPLLSKHGQAVAASLGHAARSVADFARQSGTVKSVAKALGFVATAIDNVMAGVRPLVRGLLPLFTVSASFLPQMTSGFKGIADQFAKFMTEAEKSGALKTFIQGGLDALKALFGILGNVGGILKSVFVDANAGAGGFFTVIGTVIKQVDDFLNTADGMKAIGAIWGVLKQVSTALGSALKVVLPALGKALVALAPAIGPLVTAMSKFLITLSPLLPIAGKLAAVIGLQLAKVFTILGPVILDVGKTIGKLLTKLAPLLPVIATVAAVIGKALVKALDKLMPVIDPLVKALGDGLLAVVTAIAPLLPKLAEVFAKILKAATPLIKPITDIVVAFATGLLPIIDKLMPSLDKLLAALGPALVQVITAVAPAIPRMTDAMAELVPPIIAVIDALVPMIPDMTKLAVLLITKLIPIMVTGAPVIRFLAGAVYLMLVMLKGTGAILKTVVGAIGDFIGSAKGPFLDFINWVGNVGGKIIDGMLGGLKFGWHKVTDWFTAATSIIPDSIKNILGLHSPSKVMADIGVNIGKGLAGGIKAQIPAISKVMDSVASVVSGGVATDATVKLKAAAVVTPAAAGTTSAMPPVVIHVSVANGVDPSEVGRRTVLAIEAWQKRSGRRYLVTAKA